MPRKIFTFSEPPKSADSPIKLGKAVISKQQDGHFHTSGEYNWMNHIGQQLLIDKIIKTYLITVQIGNSFV